MAIEEEFQITRTKEPEKYLSLPVVWGRSTKEALGYLKARVRDKINGWRTKILNQAGKDVLIKLVITAKLTFVMSTFKLPKIWCLEINTMISDFGWGQTNEGRKKHWR